MAFGCRKLPDEMLAQKRPNYNCPASAASMLFYRICTRSAGHLASRSDDTLRFSHGAPSVFEVQPLYLGTVTATPKEPLLFAVQTALARLPKTDSPRGLIGPTRRDRGRGNDRPGVMPRL